MNTQKTKLTDKDGYLPCCKCNVLPELIFNYDDYGKEYLIQCPLCHKWVDNSGDHDECKNNWNLDQLHPLVKINIECCDNCKKFYNRTCFRLVFDQQRYDHKCDLYESYK